MSETTASNSLRNGPVAGCDVWVLGGGISGLTTALVLQTLGLRTAVLTESVPLQNGDQSESALVPTGYAMASAYPHNLRIADLAGITLASQFAFGYFADQAKSGVERYRLYEVFEHEPERASLAEERMKFQVFDGKPDALRETIDPPCRPGAEYLWGWVFETYFADMPRYLPFLLAQYRERGGLVQIMPISADEIFASSASKVVVNCLGFGAIDFAGDSAPAVIMRGRQVLVPGAPMVTGEGGIPVAYNYTPPAEVFARGDGGPEYVHFFSREDGWVLGQTREPGCVGATGRWIGDAVRSDEIKLNGESIPVPIVNLNESLLGNWRELNLNDRRLIGRSGYRYYRDPNGEGVRLDAESRGNTLLINNYGHGGSGVTVSWGCAIKCALLLLDRVDVKPVVAAAGELERFVHKLVHESVDSLV